MKSTIGTRSNSSSNSGSPISSSDPNSAVSIPSRQTKEILPEMDASENIAARPPPTENGGRNQDAIANRMFSSASGSSFSSSLQQQQQQPREVELPAEKEKSTTSIITNTNMTSKEPQSSVTRMTSRRSQSANSSTFLSNTNSSPKNSDVVAAAPLLGTPGRVRSLRKSTVEQTTATVTINKQGKNESESATVMADPISAHILSTLDTESHAIALQKDAESLYRDFFFPMCFPWSKPRVALPPTVPRDIEDLQGVLYGDHDFEDGIPISALRGQRAFQRTYWETDYIGNYPCEYGIRRSSDPGVMELTCAMTIPKEEDHDGLKSSTLLDDGLRAEVTNCMPWHWSSRSPFGSENTSFSPQPIQQEKHQRHSTIFPHETKKEDYEKRRKQWTRKWRVSVKVAGVSSRREVLVNESMGMKENRERGDSDRKSNPKALTIKGATQIATSLPNAKRRRLMTASFPTSIQNGKGISLAAAQALDEKGFAASLGLYDCRSATFPSNGLRFQMNPTGITNPEKLKTKRVNIGRTRLIWSHMNLGGNTNRRSNIDIDDFNDSNIADFPLFGGDTFYVPPKKITYSSLLTGFKLEASSHKRPREVAVAVRVNGKFIGKEENKSPKILSSAVEDLQQSTNSCSMITKKNDNIGVMIHDEELIKRISSNAHNATCTFERRDYIDHLLQDYKPVNKKKAVTLQQDQHGNHEYPVQKSNNIASKFVSMKHGGTSVLKYIAPTFTVLPLEDGSMRTLCLSHGSMNNCGVHSILNQSAKKYQGEKVCSVCWSASEKSVVHECIDCGLVAHLECCHDKGKIWYGKEDSITEQIITNDESLKKYGCALSWRCSVCHHYNNKNTQTSNGTSSSDTSSVSGNRSERKSSRRISKIPSRYVSENQSYRITDLSSSRSSRTGYKYRPSWKCSLCPHSGGAMSPTYDSSGINNDNPISWTHEVCRIWTMSPAVTNTNKGMFSKLSDICAICGKGGSLSSDPRLRQNSMNGLVKCAAKSCNVTFHPFCALIASKCTSTADINAEIPESIAKRTHVATKDEQLFLEEQLKKDAILTKQFSLQILELEREEEKGNRKKCHIPVSFCCLHNPNREKSLWGCLPQGDILSSVMRVPVVEPPQVQKKLA